jgi:hypothetical protein
VVFFWDVWRVSSKHCSNLIYTFAGGWSQDSPQAINLNWISEKRISLVQFKRQSLCYYSFNFLKLQLFTRHSLPSTLSSISRLHSSFSQGTSLFIPPHSLAWRYTQKDIVQIITVGCRLFNYDLSYFPKGYLGFFFAALWFFLQSLQAGG